MRTATFVVGIAVCALVSGYALEDVDLIPADVSETDIVEFLEQEMDSDSEVLQDNSCSCSGSSCQCSATLKDGKEAKVTFSRGPATHCCWCRRVHVTVDIDGTSAYNSQPRACSFRGMCVHYSGQYYCFSFSRTRGSSCCQELKGTLYEYLSQKNYERIGELNMSLA